MRAAYGSAFTDGTYRAGPILVFPRFRSVVFVHGCFWHGHGCHLFTLPATRVAFWQSKIAANAERDVRAIDALRLTGWRVLIVWECALRGRREARPRFGPAHNRAVRARVRAGSADSWQRDAVGTTHRLKRRRETQTMPCARPIDRRRIRNVAEQACAVA